MESFKDMELYSSSGDGTTVLNVLSPIIIIIGHSQMTNVNIIVFHGQPIRYYFLRVKIKLIVIGYVGVGKQSERRRTNMTKSRTWGGKMTKSNLTKKSLEYFVGQMGHEPTNQSTN